MRKFRKLLLATLLVLSVAASSVPVQSIIGTSEVVQAANIKLSKSSLNLYVGKSATLKVRGVKSRVKWSSSNKSVATVTSKGKVTAKKAGSTTIKAKVGKKTLKCKVTVKEKENTNKLVYEDSCIRVYFTGIKKEEYVNFLSVGLVIENLSNYKMLISDEDTAVNGIMARDALAVEIMPGKKAVTTFDLWDDSVDNIPQSDIVSIETKFRVWNEDSEDDSYYITDSVDLLK